MISSNSIRTLAVYVGVAIFVSSAERLKPEAESKLDPNVDLELDPEESAVDNNHLCKYLRSDIVPYVEESLKKTDYVNEAIEEQLKDKEAEDIILEYTHFREEFDFLKAAEKTHSCQSFTMEEKLKKLANLELDLSKVKRVCENRHRDVETMLESQKAAASNLKYYFNQGCLYERSEYLFNVQEELQQRHLISTALDMEKFNRCLRSVQEAIKLFAEIKRMLFRVESEGEQNCEV